MIMLKNNWKLKTNKYLDIEIRQKADELGVSCGMAKTLLSRGIICKEQLEKLKKETSGIEDPFTLPDMFSCVSRIKKAVDSYERIVIYGDYDADGVTSTALMYLFLKEKGGDVDYHIPDRFTEGYGMNREVINELFLEDTTLIITVDNGISAHDEISYAKSLGIDVVVTDHHECLLGVPSDALAAVNPQRSDFTGEFKEYSGVGVAFMVAMAYECLECSLEEARNRVYEKYSDIAAIGTVSDVMSLTGENKAIVKKGLELIEKGKCHKGITALLVAAKGSASRVTAQTVGFVLGPRINAAGRMSHAKEALALFLTEDYDECCDISKKLCQLNAKRQAVENEILTEACTLIEKDGKQNKKVIVVGSVDWNHGVIGIVCSRIVEKYQRPAILFSFDGEDAKGSGRSLDGFDLAKAIDSCSQHIVKYGGHELAAGLTVKVDRLENFDRAINEYAEGLGAAFDCGTEYNIDAQLYPNEMTLPFAKELEMLEPFGQDNPEPLFLLCDAKVDEIKILSQGKHTKYILSSESISFEALMFNFNGDEEGVLTGDKINIVFTLDINEYMGRKKLSINIKDYCYDKDIQNQLEYLNDCYNKIEALSRERIASILPKREDCIPVYRNLISFCGENEKTIGYRALVGKSCSIVDYLKTRIILDMFSQSGLIKVSYKDTERIKVKICKTNKKADILKSHVYIKLQSMIE